MMRAGKDYIAKNEPEYEDARLLHLQELIKTIRAQSPVDVAEEPKTAEDKPEAGASGQVNQSKPTLKLR